MTINSVRIAGHKIELGEFKGAAVEVNEIWHYDTSASADPAGELEDLNKFVDKHGYTSYFVYDVVSIDGKQISQDDHEILDEIRSTISKMLCPTETPAGDLIISEKDAPELFKNWSFDPEDWVTIVYVDSNNNESMRSLEALRNDLARYVQESNFV